PVPAGGQGPEYEEWPLEFGNTLPPAGVCPSPVLPDPGAIPDTIQCTRGPFAASGSSTTSAAPNGADHVSGGAISAPLQVYCTGIDAPSANAGLVMVSGPVPGAALVVPAPRPARDSASVSRPIASPV